MNERKGSGEAQGVRRGGHGEVRDDVKKKREEFLATGLQGRMTPRGVDGKPEAELPLSQ